MACTDAKSMAPGREIGKRLQAGSAFALQPGDAPSLTLTSGSGDVLAFKVNPPPKPATAVRTKPPYFKPPRKPDPAALP